MSTEEAELPGEEEERSWRDRLGEVAAAGQLLLGTRLAILREELSGKAALAARGLAAVAIAAVLGIGALLLLAALLAALLAGLFKSVALGILAAVIVYATGAVVAAVLGWRALTRVRPLEFPAVAEELARDWKAVAASLSPESGPGAGGERADDDPKEPIDDIEERFRAGAE
jgi:hypothetical protein